MRNEICLSGASYVLWAARDKHETSDLACEIARAPTARSPHNLFMTAPRLQLLSRHAWWLPGACSAFAITLAVATLRPAEEGIWLSVAILCALPWSLALLLLDFGQGFADRAALIVTLGLFANAALIWWWTALLRTRLRQRQDADPHTGDA